MAAEPERLDLRGLKCPLPVMKARKHFDGLEPGTVIIVETTDPLAVIDIPAFCQQYGHELVEAGAIDGGHHFTIRRS